MRTLIAAALAAALAAAAAATPAAAATANTKDVECLVLTFVMASSKDQNNATAGALGAFYFLGKIDGATPGADLEAPMTTIAKSLKQEDVDALGKRCGAELQARGAQVTALGQRLNQLGAANAPTGAPAAPAPAPAPKAPTPKK